MWHWLSSERGAWSIFGLLCFYLAMWVGRSLRRIAKALETIAAAKVAAPWRKDQ